jgi:hypothetical protein
MSQKMILIRLIAIGFMVTALVSYSILLIEAKKEIVFLTQNFQTGTSLESVSRQLDTANYLNYQLEDSTASGFAMAIWLQPPMNTNYGRIQFDWDEKLISLETEELVALEKSAAVVLILLFVGLTIFQLLLALGKPLGEFAWGGQYKVLPQNYRLGSIMAFLFCIACISLVLQVPLEWIPAILPSWLIQFSYGALTILFGFSVLGNTLSKSKKERVLGIPLASMIFLSCFLIFYSIL